MATTKQFLDKNGLKTFWGLINKKLNITYYPGQTSSGTETRTYNVTGNGTGNDISLTIPNTIVKQELTSLNAEYPLLLASKGITSTYRDYAYFDSAVTLNPSTNIIKNAKVYEGFLQWGGTNISGSLSPVDAAANGIWSANRLAFLPLHTDSSVYTTVNGIKVHYNVKNDNLKVEYSNNFNIENLANVEWKDYRESRETGWTDANEDAALTSLITPGVSNSAAFYVGGVSSSTRTKNDSLRITVSALTNELYFSLKKLFIYLSTVNATNCYVKVEACGTGIYPFTHSVTDDPRTVSNLYYEVVKNNNDVVTDIRVKGINNEGGGQTLISTDLSDNNWKDLGTYSVTGWPGWNSIPLNSIYNFGGGVNQIATAAQGRARKIRLTFYFTGNNGNLTIQHIAMNGETLYSPAPTSGANTALARTDHLYSFDTAKTASFPGAIKCESIYPNKHNSGTLGNSSFTWSSAYIANIRSTNVRPLTTNTGTIGEKDYVFNDAYIKYVNSTNMLPISNNTGTLGASDKYWNYGYLTNINSSNILPTTTNSGALGNSTKIWASSHINSLKIGEKIRPITTNTGTIGEKDYVFNNAYIKNIYTNQLLPNVSSASIGMGTSKFSIAHINTINSTYILPNNAEDNGIGDEDTLWNSLYVDTINSDTINNADTIYSNTIESDIITVNDTIDARIIKQNGKSLSGLYAPKLQVVSDWPSNNILEKNTMYVVTGSKTITNFMTPNDGEIVTYSILNTNGKISITPAIYWANGTKPASTTGAYEIIITGVKISGADPIYTATWSKYSKI